MSPLRRYLIKTDTLMRLSASFPALRSRHTCSINGRSFLQGNGEDSETVSSTWPEEALRVFWWCFSPVRNVLPRRPPGQAPLRGAKLGAEGPPAQPPRRSPANLVRRRRAAGETESRVLTEERPVGDATTRGARLGDTAAAPGKVVSGCTLCTPQNAVMQVGEQNPEWPSRRLNERSGHLN